MTQRICNDSGSISIPAETHVMSRLVWDAPPALRRRLARSGGLDRATWQRRFDDAEIPGKDVFRDGFAELPSRSSPADVLAAMLRAAVPGSIAVGEKTPMHLQWWRYLSAAFPSARFIVLVRDPRDVIASVVSAGWEHEGLHLLAARWAHDQRDAQALLRAVPGRALLLRYEDLVRADESDVRTALTTHLGLGAPGACGAGPATPAWDASEDWKRRSSAPLDTSSIGRHREVLPDDSVRLIERVCWREMVEFGYLDMPRSEPGSMAAPPRSDLARYGLARARVRMFDRVLARHGPGPA